MKLDVNDYTYELPSDLGSVDAVSDRALELERSCAATYAYLVANSPTEDATAASTDVSAYAM